MDSKNARLSRRRWPEKLFLLKKSEKMISADKIADIAKLQSEISIKWVAVDGEIISVDRAVPTSFHGDGDTMNIRILPSGEIRTVNRNTIIEINNEEVIL